MAELERQWYWDRRTNEAYYPVETDDGAVRFVTVRHRDAVESALDADALVPAAEARSGDMDTTFDLIESFRFPEDVSDE